MRKTRCFCASALIVLTFLLSLCPTILARPPPPGYIPAGWKLAGTWTPYDLDGIRARIEVTNPSVPRYTSDHFACWIMVNSDDGRYHLSVGWAELGAGSKDRQQLFVEHADPAYHGGYQRWYGQQDFGIPDLTPGTTIWVKLTHNGYAWTAWMHWNGAWKKLITKTMPFWKAPETEQCGEVYIDPDQYGYGYVWPFPDTHFSDVYVYRGRGIYRWYYGLFTTYALADRPIYPHWINRYYNWYVYYTG